MDDEDRTEAEGRVSEVTDYPDYRGHLWLIIIILIMIFARLGEIEHLLRIIASGG